MALVQGVNCLLSTDLSGNEI